MTETKVNAAAGAATGAGVVITPLVLYIMSKVGEDPTDPLTVAAATVVGGLVVGGVTWLAGWLTRSSTSVVSTGFSPTAIPDDAVLRQRIKAEVTAHRGTYHADPAVDGGHGGLGHLLYVLAIVLVAALIVVAVGRIF